MVFVASVVGGNISLRFIPVSFNQAIERRRLFLPLLSLFIMRQKETSEVYVTLLPIVLDRAGVQGGASFPSHRVHRVFLGDFQPCAQESVLQGLLLLPSNGWNRLNLLLYMSPFALGVLMPATASMEPDAWGVPRELRRVAPFFFILVLNCVLAFSVNLTNCKSPRSALSADAAGAGQRQGRRRADGGEHLALQESRERHGHIGVLHHPSWASWRTRRRRNGPRRSFGEGKTWSSSPVRQTDRRGRRWARWSEDAPGREKHTRARDAEDARRDGDTRLSVREETLERVGFETTPKTREKSPTPRRNRTRRAPRRRERKHTFPSRPRRAASIISRVSGGSDARHRVA